MNAWYRLLAGGLISALISSGCSEAPKSRVDTTAPSAERAVVAGADGGVALAQSTQRDVRSKPARNDDLAALLAQHIRNAGPNRPPIRAFGSGARSASDHSNPRPAERVKANSCTGRPHSSAPAKS